MKVAFVVCIGLAAAYPVVNRHSIRVESLRAFEELCYERASERIVRTATGIDELVMSPEKGPEGAYQFDLFYASGKPTEWGGGRVSKDSSSTRPGVYEVRYTYLPVKRMIGGTEIVFHGVKIEVFDRSTGALIGERLNYQWGYDFFRGSVCLGSAWFDDNQAFIERVLGPQDPRFKRAEGPGRVGQRFLRAALVKTEDVTVRVPRTSTEGLLPHGSKFDYNNRTIWLPDGSFKMLTFVGAEPIPVAATVMLESQFVFVMLPQGLMQDRPARQIMFDYRTKTGEGLRDIVALIPPGVDWSNGWGIDPQDIQVDDSRIVFRLLGKKEGGSQVGSNDGTYHRKYTMVVALR